MSGVLVPTAGGDVQVDVLEVTDAELADLPEDVRVLALSRKVGNPVWMDSHNTHANDCREPLRGRYGTSMARPFTGFANSLSVTASTCQVARANRRRLPIT